MDRTDVIIVPAGSEREREQDEQGLSHAPILLRAVSHLVPSP